MGLNSAPILNNVKKHQMFWCSFTKTFIIMIFLRASYLLRPSSKRRPPAVREGFWTLTNIYILSPLASPTVRFSYTFLPISKTRTQLGNKKSVALKIEFCCPYLPQGGSAHIGKPSLSFFSFLWITLQIITSNLIVPLLNPKIFSSGNIYI